MNIKEEFHHLIDTIDDEQLLKGYYELLNNVSTQQNGELFNKLTDAQKQELYLSYENSFDEKNWISHETMLKRLEKWLK